MVLTKIYASYPLAVLRGYIRIIITAMSSLMQQSYATHTNCRCKLQHCCCPYTTQFIYSHLYSPQR